MNTQPPDSWRTARWPAAVALLLAGAAGGGLLASTLSASAADNNSPTISSWSAADHGMSGRGGAQPFRNDEQSVALNDAATLRAAALKAVPGGTVYRIETDAGDGAYEAHMQKADGTPVTVKFDKSLDVTEVEDGMGTGRGSHVAG